jgi:hypothetical protein
MSFPGWQQIQLTANNGWIHSQSQSHPQSPISDDSTQPHFSISNDSTQQQPVISD